MVGRFDRMKQGDLKGTGGCSCAVTPARPSAVARDPCTKSHPSGVRASIVAEKPGNAGGAKGCRKMDAE